MFKTTNQHITPLPCSVAKSRARTSMERALALGDHSCATLATIVAARHGVTLEEIFHHSRSRAPIAATRQVAMYLAHVVLGRSLTNVGSFFGRDRTTVSHACCCVEDLRDDPVFDDELTELEQSILLAVSRDAMVRPPRLVMTNVR